MTTQTTKGIYDLHAATLAKENRRRWHRRLAFSATVLTVFLAGWLFGLGARIVNSEDPPEVIQPAPFNDSVLRARLDSLQTEVNMLWTAVEELEGTTLSDHARAVDYVDAMEAERVTE